MSEGGQWKYKRGKKVAKSSLRPGDIVFFKEGKRKRGITHVGIYSGNGNLVHASAFFGKVVESKMRYIKGYSGAKRLKPRDRKSTRLNSSHANISYAVFCLKKNIVHV